MDQQRQRAAVKMELRLRFEGDYFLKPIKETGRDISYNIKHARRQPGLLDQYIQANIQIQYDTDKTTPENWIDALQKNT